MPCTTELLKLIHNLIYSTKGEVYSHVIEKQLSRQNKQSEHPMKLTSIYKLNQLKQEYELTFYSLRAHNFECFMEKNNIIDIGLQEVGLVFLIIGF